ncbi:LysR family transcriptional regulator [Arthrobacter sp. TMN-50]
MDVRHLKYFLGVVDHGGFGRAAAYLHVAQPSLSQAVAALERELGVELFHRTGRRVVVSEPGLALIEPARRAVRELEAVWTMVESLKGRLVGQVDLALMPSQGIEPFSTVAVRFGNLYPGVMISAHAAYTGDEVVNLVKTGVCELGLLGSTEFLPPPGIGILKIQEQDMVLLGRPGKPFRDGAVVRHEDLEGQRLISSPAGSVMRRVVDNIIASGVKVDLAVEVAHRASILPLVLAGGGLAVIAAAWSGFARQSGAAVMTLTPTETLTVALAYREGHPLTPASLAFADVIRQYASDMDR